MKIIYKKFIKPNLGIITAIIAGIILGIIATTKNLTLDQILKLFLIAITIPTILLMLIIIILTYKYEFIINKNKDNKEKKEKNIKENMYSFKIKNKKSIKRVIIYGKEFVEAYQKLKRQYPNYELIDFEEIK